MKKLTFILLLLFLSINLFALDEYAEKQIDKGVKLALSGLMESDYQILSYEEKSGDRATISIALEIDGNTYHVVIADRNLKRARKRIKEEVQRTLKYITVADSSSLTLDYEFDTNFSSVGDVQYRNGTAFLAKGIDNKTYGFLVVRNEKDMDNVTIYDSFFNNGLKPGLKLVKTGGNLLSFSFGINPYLENRKLGYSIEIDYENLSLLYPFAPLVSFSYDQIQGKSHYLFGLGVNYHLPLSTFFTSAFPLLQDGSVNAALSFIVGTEGKDFLLGSKLTVCYNWFITSNITFSVGYSNLVLASKDFGYKLYTAVNRIVMKGGVRF